eukprot:5301397-Pyramimonas_sp.AAC.1
MKAEGYGPGWDLSLPDMQQFQSLLEAAFRQIRSTNRTPIQWHHSYGAQLRKSAAPGPKGRRTVHVMDAMGKAYYHDMFYIPHTVFEHGFVKGKRREDAIFVNQITGWRLRPAGHCFAISYKDLSNAFACGKWDELEQTVHMHAKPENID